MLRRAHGVLRRVSPAYPPPRGTFDRITHPSATVPSCEVLVRLACFSHADSVQSEPGSNSSIESSAPLLPPIKSGSERLASLEVCLFQLRPRKVLRPTWTGAVCRTTRPNLSVAPHRPTRGPAIVHGKSLEVLNKSLLMAIVAQEHPATRRCERRESCWIGHGRPRSGGPGMHPYHGRTFSWPPNCSLVKEGLAFPRISREEKPPSRVPARAGESIAPSLRGSRQRAAAPKIPESFLDPVSGRRGAAIRATRRPLQPHEPGTRPAIDPTSTPAPSRRRDRGRAAGPAPRRAASTPAPSPRSAGGRDPGSPADPPRRPGRPPASSPRSS